MVAAANGACALDGVSGGLAASGIIGRMANQIGSLGGLPETRGGLINATSEPHNVHPLWRTGLVSGSFESRSALTWNPEGMTGFSLRTTFATDQITGQEAQVVVESLIRERTLIIRMSGTELAGAPTVVDFRVTMADGRALPHWLDRVGAQVLMGERPVDAEVLELHITANLSDGSTIERDVSIQAITGEIQPLVLGKRTELMPLFTDQLQHQAQRNDNAFGKLMLALAG